MISFIWRNDFLHRQSDVWENQRSLTWTGIHSGGQCWSSHSPVSWWSTLLKFTWTQPWFVLLIFWGKTASPKVNFFNKTTFKYPYLPIKESRLLSWQPSLTPGIRKRSFLPKLSFSTFPHPARRPQAAVHLLVWCSFTLNNNNNLPLCQINPTMHLRKVRPQHILSGGPGGRRRIVSPRPKVVPSR